MKKNLYLYLCLLPLLFLALPVYSQVIIDNTLFANSTNDTEADADGFTSNTFTTSATVNYLLVAVAAEYTSDTAITSIKYDGVDLNPLGVASSSGIPASGSTQKVFFYGLANPNTGTNLNLGITPSNFGVTDGGYDYAAYALRQVNTGVSPQFSFYGNGSSGDSLTLSGIDAGTFVIAGATANPNPLPAGGYVGSLTAQPGGSTAVYDSIGTGIASGNQAASLSSGSFTADLAGDYTVSYTNFASRRAIGAVVFTPVPEPQAGLLLVLGGVVFLALRRRRTLS